jgi:hypothetical protein
MRSLFHFVAKKLQVQQGVVDPLTGQLFLGFAYVPVGTDKVD